MQLFFIWNAAVPRRFQEKSALQLRLLYVSNKNALLTTSLFCDFLYVFDNKVSQIFDEKSRLLINNIDTHGIIELSAQRLNVEVLILPPSTTSRLQSLHFYIDAASQMHYECLHMKCTVDLADAGIRNVYNVDILSAMT